MNRLFRAGCLSSLLLWCCVSVYAAPDSRALVAGLHLSLGSMRVVGDSLEHRLLNASTDIHPGLGLGAYVRRNVVRYVSLGAYGGFRTSGNTYEISEQLPGEPGDSDPITGSGRLHVRYIETGFLVRVSSDTPVRLFAEMRSGLRVLPGALWYEESYGSGSVSVTTRGRIEPENRLAAMIHANGGLSWVSDRLVLDVSLGGSVYSQDHRQPPGADGFRPAIIELMFGVGYVW